VASFTPRPLCPRYPLDRRLGGPQIRYGKVLKQISMKCFSTCFPLVYEAELNPDARFRVFTAMKIQGMVLWVVTLCTDVG
jgi:hypothetical protein